MIRPFPVRIYNSATATTLNASSNGTLQFVSNISPFTTACLPNAAHNQTIFGYWADQRTDLQTGCAAFPGGQCGIFTSVTGTAPNRILNVEWRTTTFGIPAQTNNWEIRLHEADALFTVVTGTLGAGGAAANTEGVQRDTGSFFTQFSCNTAVPNNTQISYNCTLVPVELMGVSVE
jgi:hypothetical protein